VYGTLGDAPGTFLNRLYSGTYSTHIVQHMYRAAGRRPTDRVGRFPRSPDFGRKPTCSKSEKVIGSTKARLAVQKSCVFHFGILNSDRVLPMRCNIAADVPGPVISEGQILEEFTGKSERAVNEPWRIYIPPNDEINVVPGPGKYSRIGFATFRMRPPAAAFMMMPVVDTTVCDVRAVEQLLVCTLCG